MLAAPKGVERVHGDQADLVNEGTVTGQRRAVGVDRGQNQTTGLAEKLLVGLGFRGRRGLPGHGGLRVSGLVGDILLSPKQPGKPRDRLP